VHAPLSKPQKPSDVVAAYLGHSTVHHRKFGLMRIRDPSNIESSATNFASCLYQKPFRTNGQSRELLNQVGQR
jgi:hypothetical protein